MGRFCDIAVSCYIWRWWCRCAFRESGSWEYIILYFVSRECARVSIAAHVDGWTPPNWYWLTIYSGWRCVCVCRVSVVKFKKVSFFLLYRKLKLDLRNVHTWSRKKVFVLFFFFNSAQGVWICQVHSTKQSKKIIDSETHCGLRPNGEFAHKVT